MKKKVQAKRVDIVKIKMVKESSILYAKRRINSPSDGVDLVKDFLQGEDRECFLAVYVNTKNEPTAIHTVSIGNLTCTVIHPRELMKVAINANSASILLFHNHPSGDPKPSQEDIRITKRLVEAGNIMGINILDHCIIGDNGEFYSFKENNLI
ncbi:DNA repair protein RadC [Anaerovirgula multivorans]|uniref:DNA repair protein RadC n=1 Tax=Anaerovirgula multivorans TaxID=312168 RepID=A0A239KMQ1_9FIRM|nr:JAB domain-containing protein [Anaerovirgula multivorans]SNT19280.1 DNA repair protein RadC [Anaerovirgula multivorans]